MVHFGLIGYGKFGKNYAKVLKNNPFGKLTAICTRKPIPKDEFNCEVPHYEDYRWAINQKNVDCVIIATPPESHYKICDYAVRAGKHIICEKPLTLSHGEVSNLIHLTRNYPSNFYVNYIHLFDKSLPLFLKSFERIDKIDLINEGSGPIRDYSSLIDYGVHELAILRYYFNKHTFSGFKVTGRTQTTFGELFKVKGYINSIPVSIRCGSGAEERKREVAINGQTWTQPKSENPLANLIEMVCFQIENKIKDTSLLDLTNIISMDLEKMACGIK